MEFDECLRGMDKLTTDELTILVDKAVSKIKEQAENRVIVKEEIEKNFPIPEKLKVYEPKPQSEIYCCLHCGSTSFKKHGKTRSGVQRYICKDCGKTFSENYGLITY